MDSRMKIDYIIQTPSKIFVKPKSFQFTCKASSQLVIRTGRRQRGRGGEEGAAGAGSG